jgi:hypothetical protein
MNSITFIIARQLLEDKRSEVMARVKSRPKDMTQTHHARINKEVLQEVKAINDELWLLNNW